MNDGARIGVVGRNGNRKSSLPGLLTARVQPDSGRVARRSRLRVGALSTPSIRTTASAGRRRRPGRPLSFTLVYRDWLFREMMLRRSFDDISGMNGWQLNIDGIHLNTKGGRILTEVVQKFLER